tara:strand:- start:41163 stop:42740 length:1578 start_codon:yes stop_codon:yes gene_type:complete
MGDIEKKGEVEKEIGIFKTINDLPDSKAANSFRDIKSSKKNILPYLLTMLSTACEDSSRDLQAVPPTPDEEGDSKFKVPTFTAAPPSGVLLQATKGNKVKCNLIRILIEILIEFLPELIRIIKEAVVVAIREALSCGSDFQIPVATTQIVDIETIDHKGILKSNPDSNLLGGIFFGGENDFNRWLYNTMQTPGLTNTWEGPNGPLMDVTYIPPSQIMFQISSNYDENSGKTYNDFISDYMASIELFNQKIVLGNLMNSFFSNVTSNLNPSLEQVMDDEKTDAIMEKILNTDPCQEEQVYDDSFFKFSNEELLEMENNAIYKRSGVVPLDLGCGIFTFDLREDTAGIGEKLNELDELNNQNNPQKVEKNIKNQINLLQDSLGNASPSNAESIKRKFEMDAILSLPKVMCKASILTPKILGVYNFSNYIVNNSTSTERTSYDWAKSNTVFFEYVLRESLAVLVKIVFNKLKAELMRLIAKVVQKLIKSIAKKKLKILASFALPAVANAITGLINKIPQPEVAGSQYK